MYNTNYNSILKALAVVILINGLIAGCSSVPTPYLNKDEILKEAREAYNQAQQHSNATNSAELSKAKQALERAENAKTNKEVQHLAYIAKQQAKIANTIAKRQSLDMQNGQEQQRQSFRKGIKNAKNLQLQQKLNAWHKHKIGRLKLILDDGFQTTDLQLQSSLDVEIIAAFLKQHPELKVSVEGHTNNKGTNQYNLGLSKRYATTVKFALIQQGVASWRIHVKNFGETNPLKSNKTVSGQQKNQRVELFIF